MISNFGGNYSMKNLDDENFIDIQYLQICLNAQAKYQENQIKKAQYVGDE